MTERQKIAHLYRRFGFGASPEELAAGVKLGVAGTLDRLLNYETVDEQFPISPWSFCWETGSEEIYLDPYRPAAHWALRLAMTQRPLQEKLTLFWHDHFAVSATKVEIGPLMLDYLETLRRHAGGPFKDLLVSISHDPAMCFWLDTSDNQKGHPNENFAREMMELFTLGIGNYSEKDVQEAARAFTGWGIRYLLYEKGGENVQQIAKNCVKNNTPMFAFAFSPSLHDSGSKTVLGETRNWTGEDLLEFLAAKRQAATLICTKLWEFFAYPKPESAVVEKLVAIYVKENGAIKPILRAIAENPEFWSEKSVRKLTKSPIDFVVAIVRQLNLNIFLMGAHGPVPTPMVPAQKPLRDIAGAVFGLAMQEGMQLLFPPDVAGWDAGPNWISSATMVERIKWSEKLFGPGTPGGRAAGAIRYPAASLLGDARTPAEAVAKLVSVFDIKLPAAKVKQLEEAAEAATGGRGLSAQTANFVASSVCRLAFGSPEFQFC